MTTQHDASLPATAALPDSTALTQLGLSDADMPAIVQAGKALQDLSPTALQGFGREAAGATDALSTRLLDSVRNADLDASGDKLGEVVKIARSLNLDSIAQRSRVPIIGPLLDRMKSARDDLVQKYSSTNSQIDRLMREVGLTQATQGERVKQYEQMHAVVRDEHRQLGIHVAAGRMRLAELQREIATLDGQDDPTARMRRSELDNAIRLLDKRVSDLHVLQHATEQTLPMIRLIQANAMQLIEKFGTVRDVTLPMWRHQFAIQLSLADQKNAAQLANAIDDASNELLRRNAELIHQTSVETAKANQRSMLDIDTLRNVNDTLVQTIEEVRTIHREGMQQRQQIDQDIQAMRAQVQQQLDTRT